MGATFNRSAFSKILLGLFSILCTTVCMGQDNKKNIVSGNKLYRQGKFKEADKEYEEALKGKKLLETAAFNKGDALYRQKKYVEAAQQFLNAADKTTDKEFRAKSLHNLGNAFLQGQDYEKALKAYQLALMNNPSDEKTRYNLAYAKQMIKKQQQEQKKDQKKEQQQEQQKQNEDQKQGQKKEEQQPKEQENLNKQNAENMLDALNESEKSIQKKVKGKKNHGKKAPSGKDW